MLDALTRTCLRYRWLCLGLTAALALFGWQAFKQLPIDAFPDIASTQVKLILKSPGMTPEEVEQRVVKPIEQELLSVPNKRVVRSTSKYAIADITVDFEDDVDIYWARQQVSERLTQVWSELPAGVMGGLAPITTPLSDVLMFTLDDETLSPTASSSEIVQSLSKRREALDWLIRPQLRTVPGVAEVNALGGFVQTFEVQLDQARMARAGVNTHDIREVLQSFNGNDGAGRTDVQEATLLVRVQGAVLRLDDLRTTPIQTPHLGVLSLDELALVRLGSLTRYGAVSQSQGKNADETVEGIVLAMRGVNTHALVQQLQGELSKLQARLPKGLHLSVFYNRADLVERATHGVFKALFEALVLVCGVLYFFLGGWRAAAVVAVSIPLSLLLTFIMMRYLGLSANLMSLGGLAIALGMLVDASVVVVENIEEALTGKQPDGGGASAVILAAVAQVRRPVIAGVLIIAVVFVPLLSLQGLEGRLFSPVAKTIVLALMASIFVAFSVIPALAYLLLANGKKNDQAHFEPRLMRFLRSGFDALWRQTTAHPKSLAAAVGGMLVIALLIFIGVGKTFMPTMDEGDILLQLQKDPSISLSASVAIDERVQRVVLANIPQVRKTVARVGSDELGLDPMGLNETDLFLELKPAKEWGLSKEELIENIATLLKKDFQGLVFSFTQPIEMRVSEMLTGTRGDVAIKVFGHDLTQINQSAVQIAQAIGKVQGASEVIAPKVEGVRYLSVTPHRAVLGQAGISLQELQRALKGYIEGERVGVVLREGMRTPLMLKGATFDPTQSTEEFANLSLVGKGGRVWNAAMLAQIQTINGPIRIDHEQSARFALVQVNVSGRDLTGFVEEAQAAVQKLNLPSDLRVLWGGEFENQQRAAARLALVVPLSLVLIFLILMFTFGSALQGVVIFMNIPFALAGGAVGLVAAGEYLSVPGSVGFVALLGIAVLNGVVMVSHFNERLLMGESLQEATQRGTERRLRPVLMTAVITALGMGPLLFATGPGSEIQRPLAAVVMGGLLSATPLTLLVLPRLFVWAMRWQQQKPQPPSSEPHQPSPDAHTKVNTKANASSAPASERVAGWFTPMAAAVLALFTLCGSLVITPAWGAQTLASPLAPAASSPAPTLPPTLKLQRQLLLKPAPKAEAFLQDIAAWLPDAASVQKALLQSVAVKAARAQREADLASARIVRTGPYESSLRLSPQRRNVLSPTPERLSEATLALERPFRAWGKAQMDAELADLDAQKAQWFYRDALHETARDFLTRWFDLQQSQAVKTLAQANLRIAMALKHQARVRYAAGDLSEMDYLSSKAELAQMQSQAQQATTEWQARQAWFEHHHPHLKYPTMDEASLAQATACTPRDEASTSTTPTQIQTRVNDYLAHHHEVRAQTVQLERMALEVKRTERDANWPDPTLGVYATSDRGGAERVVGVTLSIPLPGSYARAAQANKARLAWEAASAKLEALKTMLGDTFRARIIMRNTACQAAQSAQDAAKLQTNAAQKAALAFSMGESDMAQSLQMQRLAAASRQNATQQVMQSRLLEAQTLLDLHQLWDMDESVGSDATPN